MQLAQEPDPEPPQLPPELLRAIAHPGGGQVVLVIGSGCSLEAPTSLPLSVQCADNLHRRLVADGILREGECASPCDLAAVADAVRAKRLPQSQVVARMPVNAFQTATANTGYALAAALLREHAIKAILTLNFDHAIVHALSSIGSSAEIGIVDGPRAHDRLGVVNIVFLHGSAYTPDAEEWVLRNDQLERSWAGTWIEVVTNLVLASPVVVFAGLGTPVPVLIKTVRYIDSCLRGNHKRYQADVLTYDGSATAAALGVRREDFIRLGWCDFMERLAARVALSQVAEVQSVYGVFVRENGFAPKDIEAIIKELQHKNLIELGCIRANWLLLNKYCPFEPHAQTRLLADLIHGLATISEELSCTLSLDDEGRCLAECDGRTVCVIVPVSGSGHRRLVAMESALATLQRKAVRLASGRPVVFLLAGIPGSQLNIAPPVDILGKVDHNSVTTGHMKPIRLSIDDLLGDPSRVREAVGLA